MKNNIVVAITDYGRELRAGGRCVYAPCGREFPMPVQQVGHVISKYQQFEIIASCSGRSG